MKKVSTHLLLALLLLALVFPKQSHAYLDPGTGSYLLQIMTAALFGGAFLVKTWWKEIKGFFENLVSRKDKTASEKHSKEK